MSSSSTRSIGIEVTRESRSAGCSSYWMTCPCRQLYGLCVPTAAEIPLLELPAKVHEWSLRLGVGLKRGVGGK